MRAPLSGRVPRPDASRPPSPADSPGLCRRGPGRRAAKAGGVLLSWLELEDFRLFSHLEVELPAGLIFLYGENAQGKTSLLEALYVLATSRSFRTRQESELIRWGAERARVNARLRRDSGRERTLEVRWKASPPREVLLEGRPCRRLAEFLGEAPMVLFTPADLALIQGGPALRRRYLDLLLCKLYPAYLEALSRTQQALRQRQELLRRPRPPAEEEIFPWDAQLARYGSQVIERRHQMCARLDEAFAELYRHLSQEESPARLAYRPAAPASEAEFLQALERARRAEMRLRANLVGPQRDELEASLGGRALRRYGSQGQQRTAALALRLAEARALQEGGGERAVVLLDDCLSELDARRRRRLLGCLEGFPQVLLTSTHPPEEIPRGGTVMRLAAGALTPER